ncbi:hypothetical protein DPMN_097075 [Dreissena polymorpha]|uniref:Uncharacterized protein n=1 Tax=Dreissena polymorpha TaxID=45954 RepID=A0A9D4LCA6_DREPO|nr:hypothetical protein DPMN_097075 [Dreissena polymorpha]
MSGLKPGKAHCSPSLQLEVCPSRQTLITGRTSLQTSPSICSGGREMVSMSCCVNGKPVE